MLAKDFTSLEVTDVSVCIKAVATLRFWMFAADEIITFDNLGLYEVTYLLMDNSWRFKIFSIDFDENGEPKKHIHPSKDIKLNLSLEKGMVDVEFIPILGSDWHMTKKEQQKEGGYKCSIKGLSPLSKAMMKISKDYFNDEGRKNPQEILYKMAKNYINIEEL
jgi:hypothetical protein